MACALRDRLGWDMVVERRELGRMLAGQLQQVEVVDPRRRQKLGAGHACRRDQANIVGTKFVPRICTKCP